MSEARESIGRKVVIAVLLALVGGAVGLVFTYHVAIWDWLFPPRPKVRPPVAWSATLETIASDLESADQEQRPLRRYLTLTHLHNDPAVPGEELQSARSAVEALLAWLAPRGQVPALESHADGCVLAFDLAEVSWDPKKQWRLVLEQYPYGLDHTEAKDQTLAAADKRLRKLTGDRSPHVRADWFVAAVVRAPLGGPSGSLKLPDREVPEVVRRFAVAYAQQTISLDRAARELGLSETEAVAQRIRKEPRLSKKLGLGPLLAEGGTIPRATWESRQFLASPFQELAGGLDLGVPESR
jgi:hypothetical protein